MLSEEEALSHVVASGPLSESVGDSDIERSYDAITSPHEVAIAQVVHSCDDEASDGDSYRVRRSPKWTFTYKRRRQ